MQRARPSPAGAPGGRAGGRRGAGARRAELGRLLPRARAPSASPPARCACALAPPAPRPRSSGDRAATAELGAAGLGARGTRARPGPHPNAASQAPRRRRGRVNLGHPPSPLPASVSPLVRSATHCIRVSRVLLRLPRSSWVKKPDSYVFNDGSSRELMKLTGTIPVPYRGTHINNPIRHWLLDTCPYNPPICFLKPTSSMTIKTGKHVDANGKIYLPYLHEWKHSQSHSGLIQVTIVVFGEEPPVFFHPTISVSYPPYQATGPPNTSYEPGTPGGISAYPSGYPSNPSGDPGRPYPPGGQYPATTGSQYPSQPPVTIVGPRRDGTISEDTLRASLISAVRDKLRWRMKEEMDRAQAELNALKRTEEDLKKGPQKLEEMVTCLDQEVAEVDKNIELLRKKVVELSSTLEKMENRSENNDIDEVIIPTAPLYKQILNLYAEENAIEDTIFHLGEALRWGVIDLDVFLKHVCLLSCKQFQLRALMQEARNTASLSDLYCLL
ncbi:LOW QUALITY PROTEIN: tumor susceptibility gene 101 protein-like [Lagenorhynchus albirostris]|uniref:LOW QUALITY PROTEIN: tumor susceptibility gene 101 protein-like n=1 Tax=Lagenorhynchus albirostris TaxID=27610 RepID=UPI0028EABD9C|nr:LOW QUALITY PROTEIN: tumor susceptibility gene 101 protein-like [Lagenorhynchus albirostris]